MSEEASLDPKALEEAVNQEITQKPIPIDSVLVKLVALRTARKDAITERLARSIQTALIGEMDFDGLVKLLSVQAEWLGDSLVFGEHIPLLLKKATKDRTLLVCLDSCMFGKVKASESLRRLALLRSMKNGMFFFDKTWGFGVIKRIDPFYKRLLIDFSIKKDHTMSLEYAASTLAPVASDHILARFHTEPAAIRAMVKNTPGKIVEMLLQSFGPSTVQRIESLLEEYRIIESGEWKTFWKGARSDFKNNKFITIPAKRSEPITIRKTQLSYDETWFTNELKIERNIPKLFEVISGYEAADDKPEITEIGRKILTDRLNFAIDGAFLCPPPMFTRLILMAQRLNIQTPAEELIEKLLDENRFMVAGDKLSSKESEEMVDFIIRIRPEAVGLLLAQLPAMSFNLTCKTLDVLKGDPDYLKSVQDRCRELLAAATVPAALLVWTIRNWATVKDWGLPAFYELMEHAIAINEDTTLAGEQLRLQHLLHGFYADLDWFEAAFTSLTDLQREAIFYRLYGNTSVAEPALLKKLIAKMIEIAPALANKKFDTTVKKEPPALRFTSWRMLRERQELLKHIIEIDIPKNREDIAYARGLGDLRENFEYQSAKDTQRVLMARREELDAEIKTMHGTNFPESDADTSVVGMGVTVVITRADGTDVSHAILGEWDSDEALKILPNRSKLATILSGKHVGDTAKIPTINGEETVTVKAILPLSAAVRAWIGAETK